MITSDDLDVRALACAVLTAALREARQTFHAHDGRWRAGTRARHVAAVARITAPAYERDLDVWCSLAQDQNHTQDTQ